MYEDTRPNCVRPKELDHLNSVNRSPLCLSLVTDRVQAQESLPNYEGWVGGDLESYFHQCRKGSWCSYGKTPGPSSNIPVAEGGGSWLTVLV